MRLHRNLDWGEAKLVPTSLITANETAEAPFPLFPISKPTEEAPVRSATEYFVRIGARDQTGEKYYELDDRAARTLAQLGIGFLSQWVASIVAQQTKSLRDENETLMARLRTLEEARVMEFRLPETYLDENESRP